MTRQDTIYMYITIGLVIVIVMMFVVAAILDNRSKKRAEANGGIDPKRPQPPEWIRNHQEKRAEIKTKVNADANTNTSAPKTDLLKAVFAIIFSIIIAVITLWIVYGANKAFLGQF